MSGSESDNGRTASARTLPPKRIDSSRSTAAKVDGRPVSRPESGLVKGTNKVYVTNIPSDYQTDDITIEIKTKLKKKCRLEVDSIEYFKELGICIIQVSKTEDKDYLINDMESLSLNKEGAVVIQFVEDVQIDAFCITRSTGNKTLSIDQIRDKIIEEYHVDKTLTIRTLGSQFPSIYRIVMKNIIEYSKLASQKNIKIGDSFANFYVAYDCSFLEDLPPKTKSNELISAIKAQYSTNKTSDTDYQVQVHEKSGTAVVLAKNMKCKEWINADKLLIQGGEIMKKNNVSYRLILKFESVPDGFDMSKIRSHVLLSGKVISMRRVNDCVIVEVDSAETYQYCKEVGGCKIGDLQVEIRDHYIVDNPDDAEIDDITWYEMGMRNFKEEFLQIIKKPENPIFHYRWNSSQWIEQMNKAKPSGGNHKESDRIRHLLRVTVMLNTVGVLWKQKYFIGRTAVELQTKRLKTIVYYHDSLLFTKTNIPLKNLETAFPLTEVKVVEDDCLVVYEQLVEKSLRPVLLNMANAVNPGGGYRKGDAAQEENIFRRSDYYRSLDVEASGKNHSDFSYHDEKGDIKPLKGIKDLYPMEEFGAIYTAGITVFRHSEDRGYEFMNKPLNDVCSIAMAAYREPKLTDDNKLVDEFAMKTLKKIENIFAIAHHQKHDCLVLSALGCGAFKNPPDHVALLFKSVIQQYAGFFKYIYFAIINDHNAKGKINPDGNFAPFKNLLHKKKFYPPEALEIGLMIGPHHVVQKSNDDQISTAQYKILDKPPCHHGSKCRDINNQHHSKNYSHPPFCGIQRRPHSCAEIDEPVHSLTYRHTTQCLAGIDCKNLDNLIHLAEFDHPDFCKLGGKCQSTDSKHLASFRHPPDCKNGTLCKFYMKGDVNHNQSYRHVKTRCSDDNCCIKFFDDNHLDAMSHTFLKVCPFTPYTCDRYILFTQGADKASIPKQVEQHCLKYSHMCSFGRSCKNIKDTAHLRTNIHVARIMCPDDASCVKLSDEDHLDSFTHSNIRDIRLICREPGFSCPERSNDDHFKRFRHGKNLKYPGVVPGANTDRLVNFVQNQQTMMRNLQEYMHTEGWLNKNPSQDLINWVLALQPMHRCRRVIFESILEFGHVMSIDYMKLLNKSKHVSGAVMNHPEIRALFLRHQNPEAKKKAEEWITTMVRIELLKDETGVPPDKEDNLLDEMKIAENILKKLIGDDVETIRTRAMKIVQSAIKLNKAPTGIGFGVDVEIETNKYVFSIIGPHRGTYYGDVVIAFKQELLYHPHSYFTPQAGTSFMSGKTYTHRPWVKDPTDRNQRAEIFHQSRLSYGVTGFEHVAASELAAVTGLKDKSLDVSVEAITKRWCKTDSHEVFEGHLPPLIPLDYIDKVYIPKNMFQAMSDEAKKVAKSIFQESLILADFNVDLAAEKSSGVVPLDDTRKSYADYILRESTKSIERRQKTENRIQGFMMTLAGSNFEQHMLIPVKISDSYQLYRADKKHTPESPEYTYIYWQVLNGDMMLTIANEQIKLHEDQKKLRSLVCYIAEKPATNKPEYHEEYSYLTNDHPVTHYARVNENRFRAKSNRMFAGCNTENFLSFCLEINHKQNSAKLFHVGPNSIYNHEKIFYNFEQSSFDLSRLDYVHVSAGKKDVPIRQLRITHEKLEELHLSRDKKFNIDTSIMEILDTDETSPGDRPNYIKANPKKPEEPKPLSVPSGIEPKISSVPYGIEPKSTPVSSEITQPEKPGIIRRVLNKVGKVFGSDEDKARTQPHPEKVILDEVIPDEPAVQPSRLSKDRKSSAKSSSSSDSESPIMKRDQPPKSRSPVRASHAVIPKLPSCPDSIYCLELTSKDHTEKYSHPCRFNELCTNKHNEPNLVHTVLNNQVCPDNRDCTRLCDPIHRSQYRHRGLPDFLIPCKFEQTCYSKSADHRQKFFHGEEIPGYRKMKMGPKPAIVSDSGLKPCKYGKKCWSQSDPSHTAKFSHLA